MQMTTKQQQNQDKLLVQLIYKDFQPFSIVDDEGFKAYSKGLNPSYKLMGRTTLSEKAIPAKYEEVRILIYRNYLTFNLFYCFLD